MKKKLPKSEEILVVTNDVILGEIIGEHCSTHDMSSRIVTKYEKALDIMHDKEPRALIIDFDVPKESCLEFLAHISKLHPQLYIALIARLLTPADISQVRALGVSAVYLKHHYHPADMIQALFQTT